MNNEHGVDGRLWDGWSEIQRETFDRLFRQFAGNPDHYIHEPQKNPISEEDWRPRAMAMAVAATEALG